MNTSNKTDANHLRTIVAKHYPSATIVDIEDLSKGCDNWIFCATLSPTDTKIIIRLPRKLDQPDCPAMHWPRLQAQVLTTLAKHDIPVPKLLHESSDYLIESYLGETDLSNIEIKDNKQLTPIMAKMGFYVKKLHSIDCCQRFGYIVEFDSQSQTFVGKYENWITMFQMEYPLNLNGCLEQGLINQQIFDKLDQLFDRVKPYLENYNQPKLLHSDICANNTRVVFNNEEKCYQFTGFIDWADAMSGDPLYDLGELLISYFGDYSVIQMFEQSYETLTPVKRQMIVFYAIHYNLWLLNGSVLSDLRDKWLSTLDKLTKLVLVPVHTQ